MHRDCTSCAGVGPVDLPMEPPTLLDLLALDQVAHLVLRYIDPPALARLQGCSRETRNIEELGAAWRLKLETVLFGDVWWQDWQQADDFDGL